jgi:hypothetical protein
MFHLPLWGLHNLPHIAVLSRGLPICYQYRHLHPEQLLHLYRYLSEQRYRPRAAHGAYSEHRHTGESAPVPRRPGALNVFQPVACVPLDGT